MVRNLILIGLLVASCTNSESDRSNRQMSSDTLISYQGYLKVFQQIDSLLQIDNGKLWGHQLYGPIMLIDPQTRIFVSNQNNFTASFTKIGEVYIDTLPDEINIANTAIDWGQQRWTMVMTPLPEDASANHNLIIHELFHRIQPELGFDNLNEQTNGHLDSYSGRVLLKLELEALRKSLNVDNLRLRSEHLANALAFRLKRQSDPNLKISENSLEINEGLAEYTGVILSSRSKEELEQHFSNSIDRFYINETFVRSFAYQTVPIYGFHLKALKPNWSLEITAETVLTDYFIRSFDLDIPLEPYEAIASDYDYNFKQIILEERTREERRKATIAKYKEIFLEKPTLTLYLKDMSISFDPRNITPLEDLGTIYPNLKVIDKWGTLTVEEGALLSADWTTITVSAPTEIQGTTVNGSGWKLELNEPWEIEESLGNFQLIQN